MKKYLSMALLLGAIISVTAAGYTVKEGDYLSKIAKENNTNIQTIKNLNNLTGNTIYAGQDLKLPGVSVEKAWELKKGVSQPESVLSIPNHDYIYVSSVNGEDRKGFISKISKTGEIIKTKWIDGIQTPTGMDYYNGNIYVADQKQVHVISVDEARIIKTLPSEGKTLNDIAISPLGQIFVSDLTSGTIYTVENDTVVPWLKSTEFPFPNGVLVKNGKLLVGNVGSKLSRNLQTNEFGSIYEVNMQDKSVNMITSTYKLGAIDGIVEYNGGTVVTNPFSGELIYVGEDGNSVLLKENGGIADIGIDADEPVIYAPFLFESRLVAYKVKGEEKADKWERVETKEQFMETVADKFFGDEAGQSVATSSGKIFGIFGGMELNGDWEWKDGYFSRTSTLGDMDLGHDDIVIEVTENKMKLTLKKGTGPSVVYDKKK